MKKLYSFAAVLCMTLTAHAEINVVPALSATSYQNQVAVNVAEADATAEDATVWGDWQDLGTASVSYCGAPYSGTKTGAPMWRRDAADGSKHIQYRIDGYLFSNIDGVEARPLVIDIIDDNLYVYPQELPALDIKDQAGNKVERSLSVVDYATATENDVYRVMYHFNTDKNFFEIWLCYYFSDNGEVVNQQYIESITSEAAQTVELPSFMAFGGENGMGFLPAESSAETFMLEYAIVKGSGADAEGKSLADRLEAKDQSLMIMSQMAGQIMVAPAEGPGRYTIAVAAYDINEKLLGTSTCKIYWMPVESWNWESLGEAEVTENFLADVYGFESPTYKVEIQKSVATPGLYRLVNLYGDKYPYAEAVTERTVDFTHYTYLHCEDPAHCYVEETTAGIIMDASGEIFIGSTPQYYSFAYGYPVEAIAEMMPEAFGSLSDGVITFPAGTLMATATVLLDNGYDWLAVGSQGAFKIVLPGKDGVADISAGDNAPAEYYNLQGIRVDNPVPGTLYIRRQGSDATKIVY